MINEFNLFSIYPSLKDRHPGTVHLMRTLHPNPKLPVDALRISQRHWDLAMTMVQLVPDGPELSAGLRKLREAKDCFVLGLLTS